MNVGRYLALYDYRQRVALMYRERNGALRAGHDPEAVLQHFRARRDELFATHPQSALDDDQRSTFRGLAYFPYRPDAIVAGIIEPARDTQRLVIQISERETVPLETVGTIKFTFGVHRAALSLYWIEVYGGGLFLPFRDRTAPDLTYGGGRYVFDTIKGSDFLSVEDGRLSLDFNYAYNPSCAYNHRWTCPLAPPSNQLPFPIAAGEKRYLGATS
ncbi:MAG: DUF1684 domain-containing protein [Chloroflexota bacterium]|nr:DUF1684 domain-containing protein [Chloroflexota bacterium]